MPGYVRGLAVVLLLVGLGVCVVAATWAVGDEAFFKAREALERHPDHVLFQGEYYAALLRHLAYYVIAVVVGLLGVVASGVLFALHGVMLRLERLEARLAASGSPAR